MHVAVAAATMLLLHDFIDAVAAILLLSCISACFLVCACVHLYL